MYILYAKVEGIKNFESDIFEIDYTANKRVSAEEVGENVTRIKNSLYKLNAIAITGKNASGKTTALNIIKGIQDIYLNNESLTTDNSLVRYLKASVTIHVKIFDAGYIYSIKSHVINTKDEVYFENETIDRLTVTSKFSKKIYDDPRNYESFLSRKELDNTFLKKEDSIFSGILNQKASLNKTYDLMMHTNFNYLSHYSESMSEDMVKLLDSSIDEFTIQPDANENDKIPKFRIKFKGTQEAIHCDLIELENYLSSGTIRTLNILSKIIQVLHTGGYLIIDEIENHLNKRIIQLIIEFFTGELNAKGATLIFSTHYVEVLDTIDRSDAIYVTQKTPKSQINRFSDLLGDRDRNDKKKSDLFLSGIIDTMPTYQSYRGTKNIIAALLQKGDAHEKD
ncbi:AAA family ATPase [Staphylococcus cornubiensis]|uniref:AAA family ATPase n=1 Tax=Staphylococcus cornubiensis TaxID=1986155 RepID=UPI000A3719DC|nr:AAA family ATPase [Staphylococcus cornubiensis]